MITGTPPPGTYNILTKDYFNTNITTANVSLDPYSEKIPVSDSNAKIDTDWLYNTKEGGSNNADKVVLVNDNGYLSYSLFQATYQGPRINAVVRTDSSTGLIDDSLLNVSTSTSANKIVKADSEGKIDTNWLDIGSSDGQPSTTASENANKVVMTTSAGTISTLYLPVVSTVSGVSVTPSVQAGTVSAAGMIPTFNSNGVLDNDCLKTTSTPEANTIVITNSDGKISSEILDNEFIPLSGTTSSKPATGSIQIKSSSLTEPIIITNTNSNTAQSIAFYYNTTLRGSLKVNSSGVSITNANSSTNSILITQDLTTVNKDFKAKGITTSSSGFYSDDKLTAAKTESSKVIKLDYVSSSISPISTTDGFVLQVNPSDTSSNLVRGRLYIPSDGSKDMYIGGTDSNGKAITWRKVMDESSVTTKVNNVKTEITNSVSENYLPLTGGTMTGDITLKSISSSESGAKIIFPNGTMHPIGDDIYIGDGNNKGCLAIKSHNGGETGIAFYKYDDGNDYTLTRNGGTSPTYRSLTLDNETLELKFNSNPIITSKGGTFTGNVTFKGGTFDDNVTFKGHVTLKSSQYSDTDWSTSYAINCSNSNIIKVNSIKFADYADYKTEGLWFRHSNSTAESALADIIYAKDGNLYFVDSYTPGSSSSGTTYKMRATKYKEKVQIGWQYYNGEKVYVKDWYTKTGEKGINEPVIYFDSSWFDYDDILVVWSQDDYNYVDTFLIPTWLLDIQLEYAKYTGTQANFITDDNCYWTLNPYGADKSSNYSNTKSSYTCWRTYSQNLRCIDIFGINY